MGARIGFDQYTIGHRGLSARETLAFARERRLDGVQFLDPSVITASLDSSVLDAFKDEAQGMGLYLEVGLPSPNPFRQARALSRPVSNEELAKELARYAAAVARLNCRHARAYIGDRHDRFRRDPPWKEQLLATESTLRLLTPALRDLGIKVAIETHADLTSGELFDLLGRLDPDAFGVTLDTGNLAMRLDDPVAAVERLADRVLCTHVKDCVVVSTPRGGCWQARPLGEGVLPLAPMIDRLIQSNRALNLSIELHPRTYDLPWNDPAWLAFFPEESRGTLPAVQALARLAEERVNGGRLPRPEDVEAIPWAERDLDWLDRSTAFLRGLTAGLEQGRNTRSIPLTRASRPQGDRPPSDRVR